jgi:hypothetical protein
MAEPIRASISTACWNHVAPQDADFRPGLAVRKGYFLTTLALGPRWRHAAVPSFPVAIQVSGD